MASSGLIYFAEADALVYIHTLSRTVVRPTDRRVAAIIAKNLRLPSRLAVQQLVLVNSPAPFLGRAQSQQRCAFLPRSKLGRNTVAALLKPPRETKLEKERKNRVTLSQIALALLCTGGCCMQVLGGRRRRRMGACNVCAFQPF